MATAYLGACFAPGEPLVMSIPNMVFSGGIWITVGMYVGNWIKGLRIVRGVFYLAGWYKGGIFVTGVLRGKKLN